ncbi:MAG: sigma-54-dependent Fis family transcriptional regulator [Calditrichaeota bacterium]|nr:MAG: sigma-54-dependent Fis family transcriptional regulator [Calditrichota bacterium]
MKAKILIVDDEKDLRWAFTQILESNDFRVFEAANGEEALKVLKKVTPDVILLDQMMPGKWDGFAILQHVKNNHPEIQIIMLTAFGEIKLAVKAVKMGAFDYLTKPVDEDVLILTIERALEKNKLLLEVSDLRKKLENRETLEHIMGKSPAIKKIHRAIEKVASTNFTVLIQGESGTGKEIVARAIHDFSHYADGPFVAVDCGAIPDTLVESELFGYEKGAFTGADRAKPGHFELAHKGTIFLDEIGNLPYHVQQKLLRVIQEKQIQRLGAKSTRKINVRIIAATNTPLDRAVQEGTFRSDLYYRLNEFIINIPPLRQRKEDIIYLAQLFFEETKRELNKPVSGMTEGFIKRLLNHPWKGNVRELKNVIRRAVLICDGFINESHLIFDNPDPVQIGSNLDLVNLDSHQPLKEIVKDVISTVEREVIARTLKKTRGNKSKAARQLDIDYKTLLTKIKGYGIRSIDYLP